MTQSVDGGIRRVLALRPYRWYLLAYFLDLLCSGVWYIMLGWVIARTNGEAQAGVILLVAQVPLILVLVFCSGWIDKKASRNVAVLTLAARVVLMMIWVAVATHADSTPFAVVAVIGGVMGAVDGLHEPAMLSYPIAILPDEEGVQAPAMVIERAAHRMSNAVSGIIAGGLLGWGGFGAAAAASAALVILAFLVMSWLNSRLAVRTAETDVPIDEPAAPAEAPGSTIWKGAQFVRTHGVLRQTIAVQSVLGVMLAGLLAVGVPYLARDGGWTAREFGGVMTAFGVGTAASIGFAFYAQRLPTMTRVALACGLAGATGGFTIVAGFVTQPINAAITLGLLGLCLGTIGPLLSGYLREEAARADRARAPGEPTVSGRVGAFLILATDAFSPVGFIVALAITAAFSLTAALVLLGTVGVLVSARSLLSIRRAAASAGPVVP